MTGEQGYAQPSPVGNEPRWQAGRGGHSGVDRPVLAQPGGTKARERHECHGRAPHGGCFMQQADGVFRDYTGRELPDGPDDWS